ncbi:reverse transcriptase [Gossypium australe]|uniref:Reverse transcriptase n=1 Tax=Gossypium australe TaxID=47621 RepID=A0A5B6VUN6_9ROSI|nr:reverse transcriptase [Gossypium australe]
MDFIKGLPSSKGKNVILVVMDHLMKYAHFMALSHPFFALIVVQVFLDNMYKLHGMPDSIISARDKIFVSHFWQDLFKKVGTKLHLSITYHPEIDGKTKVLNRCLEAEWWYNSTFHSAIQCTPYEALYGQSPPLHTPYLAGMSLVATMDRSLQCREAARQLLKFYLRKSQDRMRQQADKHRTDHIFDEGDWHLVRKVLNKKLASKIFGPYRVVNRIGKIPTTTRLEVPPTFHVLQLKKHVGTAPMQPALPVMDDQGSWANEPIRIIDRRTVKRGNAAAIEVLVEWANSFPKDVTWEPLKKLKMVYPHFDP